MSGNKLAVKSRSEGHLVPFEGLSLHVLLIDDNPANLMLTQAVLELAGHRVECVVSSEEALESLRVERPDVILVDVRLPGMDGLALTRHLKADASTAAIPVVVLTAHAMKETEAEAFAAGCTGFFSKPFDTRTLARDLAAVLRRADHESRVAPASVNRSSVLLVDGDPADLGLAET